MIGGTTGILGEWGPESPENRYEGANDCPAGAGKIKEWRTVRIGMDAGLDEVFAALSHGRDSFPIASVSGDVSRQQRDHTRRVALAYTIFPTGGWRPNAPTFWSASRKGRHGLARATGARQQAKRHQTGDSL